MHDVACRQGFCTTETVGEPEEGEKGFLAIADFHEVAVVFGNLPTLVVGGLGVEAVVKQIECLGVCSFVRQREGIEVDGVYEVDGQIATATLAFADEVVFVGGGNE